VRHEPDTDPCHEQPRVLHVAVFLSAAARPLPQVTDTRKNLLIAMVTTPGVVDNAYATELVASSVVTGVLLNE
jgi:hypothetical protein